MSVLSPVVQSWDGENRRAYLYQGITTFDWILDIYHEYRDWRKNFEDARVWRPLLRAEGNIPKGGGKFTPRYVVLLEGFRIIPFDENIALTATGEAVTDNPDVDPNPFDLSTRTQPIQVYITPSEAEVIVVGGSGGDSKEDVYNYFTTSGRQESFKSTGSLEIINQGIQKASKLIPHNTNL